MMNRRYLAPARTLFSSRSTPVMSIGLRGGGRLDLHHADRARVTAAALVETGFLVSLGQQQQGIETELGSVLPEGPDHLIVAAPVLRAPLGF